MTDNYVLALEKDRDTRLAELERCRSEVERFVTEVDRLTRERNDLRALCGQLERGAIDVMHERAEAIRERDEWKARAEAAEAETKRLEEWCTSLREENDSVRRKEAALLERLRAAEKVVEAARKHRNSDRGQASCPLARALDAYDATGEGKVTIVTTTPAYQGVITLVPEQS